jgi:hypothetical protein
MSIIQSNNLTHNATVAAAEGVRQAAVAAAATQAAAIAAEITFYRVAVASALTNSVSPSEYLYALRALGVGQ